MIGYCFFFFFSSRRRHTRFDCDWSSDVCSSDLDLVHLLQSRAARAARRARLCHPGLTPHTVSVTHVPGLLCYRCSRLLTRGGGSERRNTALRPIRTADARSVSVQYS